MQRINWTPEPATEAPILAQILDIDMEETIGEEQVQRILEPVIQIIRRMN